ncbi:MAG: hypothetical protein EAY75_13580 [Bacteroidetes bacterium]|nr:MAG: hypothetical protein EAY75_13580 [Bacteroidota bacterium]
MPRVLLFVLLLCWLAACNSPFVPRPKGYFAVPLPPKEYRLFDSAGFPYSFEYPLYATVVKDSTFFDAQPENPWWINLDVPSLNGRIYLSYKQIANGNFQKLVNDAFKLTNKHNFKASSIDDSLLRNPQGVSGIFFNVGGNAASAYQFFLTDSSRHFLRGALYFEAPPNADSLQPMNNFLKQDLLHLMQTLRWR